MKHHLHYLLDRKIKKQEEIVYFAYYLIKTANNDWQFFCKKT